LTKTSSPPSSSASASMTAAAARRSVVSKCLTTACRPSWRTSVAVSSAPCRSVCQVIPTFNPDLASSSAVARPIPESEPVTIAVTGKKAILPLHSSLRPVVMVYDMGRVPSAQGVRELPGLTARGGHSVRTGKAEVRRLRPTWTPPAPDAQPARHGREPACAGTSPPRLHAAILVGSGDAGLAVEGIDAVVRAEQQPPVVLLALPALPEDHGGLAKWLRPDARNAARCPPRDRCASAQLKMTSGEFGKRHLARVDELPSISSPSPLTLPSVPSRWAMSL
jgi:hypothetical protein